MRRWSYHRRCLLAAATLVVCPGASAWPTFNLTEYTSVALPSLATYGVVCSAYDTSVCANVSDFYRFRQRHLQRMTIVATVSEHWGVRASVISGARAPKLTVDPRLVIGLIGSRPLSNGRTFSAEVFGSVGGDVRHKPCIDDYEREYFCGALTAWSDFPNKRIAFHEYGMKVLYRF